MQTTNPKLYRELSEPFPNEDAAEKALESFREELETLRAKHKIADVIAVLQVNALSKDGEEGVMTATVSFGNALRKLLMLAQALGREQQLLESSINALVSRKS